MPTISKSIADASVRTAAFEALAMTDHDNFVRISNQSYGAVFTDTNGVERMVEIKAVVRKVDEEISAQEMLDTEVAEYAGKIAKAEAAAQEKREKAEKAKAKREAAKAKKEAEAEED